MIDNKKQEKESFFSWVKSILLSVGLFLLIKTFLFAPYLVDGASMEPTLYDNERLFVNKLAFMMSDIERQEIVIIKDEKQQTHYVKRVIGLPGDIVQMKDDQLYVNDKLVQEPYLSAYKETANTQGMRLTGDFGPIEVPEQQFFVMGDNRLRSMDSRNGLGLIWQKDIVGKSEFVFFPMKEARSTN
ncbi:signal peptidase I [Metabacillus iocasae]|uniref:Signal peptidase I n=1 Tax=Priestia iocasae TaxID=2291674 RepID=A0ABS2QU93_9BACI|nr:signal peptidase I [Metabacillus iocasae]MBM7703059.1 signal peptidase I [Metabacillus iocasae]